MVKISMDYDEVEKFRLNFLEHVHVKSNSAALRIRGGNS